MPPAVYLPGEAPHNPSSFSFPGSLDKFCNTLTTISNVQREDESDDSETSESSSSLTSREASPQIDKAFHAKNNLEPSDDDNGEDETDDGLIPDGEITNNHLQHQTRTIHSLHPAELVYPRSQYPLAFTEATESFENSVLPLPICKERTAVEELLDEIDRQNVADPAQKKYSRLNASFDEYEFTEFELDQFSVYLPITNHHHPFEMRPLDYLASKMGNSCFLFDGVLSIGGLRRYVQGIPFRICSIGNYGESHDEVGQNIWIQSDFNAKNDIYYHLKAPSPEYARFHDGFLWLANLAKHFVDYCRSSRGAPRSISVHDFRADFSHWALMTHGASPCFEIWYRQYQSHDFRRAVAQNITFLFKEAVGVDDNLRSHRIWSELMDKTAIRKHEIREQKTIVTPYVYDCFSHLRFGKHLKALAPATEAEIRRASQGIALHLTLDEVHNHHVTDKVLAPIKKSQIESLAQQTLRRQQMISSVKIGDVLSVVMDGNGSVWKDEVSRWKVSDNCWYLLVQGIHVAKNGERSFDGIWLYKSFDTTCAKMKYPFRNELFLSDHCTCRMGREKEEHVLHVVTVTWHGSPSESQSDFFIRQTYLDGERFVTLKDAHKKCEHLQQKEDSLQKVDKYQPGETVLVTSAKVPGRNSKHGLEPYEVVSYDQDGPKRFAILRRLLRKADLDGQDPCAPNELVYTDKLDRVPASTIEHHCLIRFYSEADVRSGTIPPPYSRNGTGNAFYITMRLLEKDGLTSFTPITKDLPSSLVQGFDPQAPLPRDLLRGMDLYCGGGNFGRGLEEGGAVHHKWAIDLSENAIHTYYANLRNPADTKLFFGSVDDLLTQALKGNPRNSSLIPLPGEVDFISAGSPCQGFSLLNFHKNSDRALKNQSLVASVAAYVDLYRPKYGLLENVMSMAQKGRGRDEDVLSQLICAIVGIGYQVEVFVLDAWSCGSAQSRSRLFVSFAAPGYEPIEHPKLSHSHPLNVREVGVGLKSNGETFGHRRFDLTAFEYVTASEATSDLPRLGDGRTFQCTPYPDHVVTRPLKEKEQARIACIPTHPRGMNFVKTWNSGKGTMTRSERNLFPHISKKGELRACIIPGSNAWGRVDPNRLFGTIVVSISAEDARMGTCIHWNQQRLLTIMEGRRAQSFPDNEVLVGNPNEQWKIVGNSVARTVALALGLSLREAWLKNPPNEEQRRIKSKTNYVMILPPAQIAKSCQQVTSRSSGDSSDEAFISDHQYRRSLRPCLSQPTSRDEIASSRSSATTSETAPKRKLGDTAFLPPQKKGRLSKQISDALDNFTKAPPPYPIRILDEEQSQRSTPRPMVILPGSKNSVVRQASILPTTKGGLSRLLNPSTLSKKLEVVIVQKNQQMGGAVTNIDEESDASTDDEKSDVRTEDEDEDTNIDDEESDDLPSLTSSAPTEVRRSKSPFI